MNAGFSSKDVDSVRPNSDTVFGNGHPSDASSGLSILLVDDNRHVAESLGVAMRLAGHRLAHAEGPEAALSLLASQRFDAILLDLNYSLGQTDGAEGLALLARLHVEDPAARIVVITAHSGIRIAVAAMRAASDETWTKRRTFQVRAASTTACVPAILAAAKAGRSGALTDPAT